MEAKVICNTLWVEPDSCINKKIANFVDSCYTSIAVYVQTKYWIMDVL